MSRYVPHIRDTVAVVVPGSPHALGEVCSLCVSGGFSVAEVEGKRFGLFAADGHRVVGVSDTVPPDRCWPEGSWVLGASLRLLLGHPVLGPILCAADEAATTVALDCALSRGLATEAGLLQRFMSQTEAGCDE